MNLQRLQHYLSTGEYVPAEDASPTSLAAHDKRWHPHGFDPKKDHCEFREKLKKGDDADSSVPPATAAGKKKPWKREYDEIVAKYKGTDKWLKAPNGQPTNLTERQWVLVRTPSFKAWFGDWEKDPANASKVIDSNGEPLVVWHGLKIKDAEPLVDGNDVRFVPKFKVFKTKKEIERGAYFAAEKGRAEPYSEAGFTASFFLNIRNPLITERTLSKKPKGSDGAYRDQVGLGKEWVAFSPDQIKSATDNSGAFSPEKENIMDGAADAPRKPSLRDIAAAALAEDE